MYLSATTTKSVFKQVTVSLNLEFSFSYIGCYTKLSLTYYVNIMRRRTDEFMPFLKALLWSKMQTILSRIWIWVAKSISKEVYQYATSDSQIFWIKQQWKKLKKQNKKRQVKMVVY